MAPTFGTGHYVLMRRFTIGTTRRHTRPSSLLYSPPSKSTILYLPLVIETFLLVLRQALTTTQSHLLPRTDRYMQIQPRYSTCFQILKEPPVAINTASPMREQCRLQLSNTQSKRALIARTYTKPEVREHWRASIRVEYCHNRKLHRK